MKIKKKNFYKDISNINREWKEKNKLYLKEMQIFFDKIDEIKDKNLKQRILSQMLICDNVLTEIAEEKFYEFYKKGYKRAKNG